MAKQIYYRQCRLIKKLPSGDSTQVSWIPEPYCVKGKVLKLKDKDGVWEDGWVVEDASGEKVLKEDLSDPRTMIKKHRENTGDSLPKGRSSEHSK